MNDPSSGYSLEQCPLGALTDFASADRFHRQKVQEQASILEESPLAKAFLNGGTDAFLIVNPCRQIVAASGSFRDLTHVRSVDDLLGLRPGEVLNCVNAYKNAGGCGTSEFCRECGAVKAIMSGLAGNSASEECRMTRSVDGETQSLELQVFATPIEYRKEAFALVSIHDISHEKRRRALERIFFHDVINLAGGMEGILFGLRESAPPELKQGLELSYSTLREMIEEIVQQRDLSAAEMNELPVVPTPVNALQLLTQIQRVYGNYAVAKRKALQVKIDSCDIAFLTDPTLLRRVLGNLVKNAIEASSDGDTIRIKCERLGDEMVFSVTNPKEMLPEVSHQVFQRSFSTKGIGRGLGTYSVKLIGEKYLRGSVTFSSQEGEGTTFRVVLPLTLS